MRSLTTEEQQIVAEQAAVEYQALQHVKQALRVALSWRTTADNLERKLSSVRFMAQSLERHMERLMSLEEEGGYMGAIVEQKPQYVERVAMLRGDHDRFRMMLREVMLRFKEVARGSTSDAETCCSGVTELLARIDIHDRGEQALWQEMLLQEEGGESG